MPRSHHDRHVSNVGSKVIGGKGRGDDGDDAPPHARFRGLNEASVKRALSRSATPLLVQGISGLRGTAHMGRTPDRVTTWQVTWRASRPAWTWLWEHCFVLLCVGGGGSLHVCCYCPPC